MRVEGQKGTPDSHAHKERKIPMVKKALDLGIALDSTR